MATRCATESSRTETFFPFLFFFFPEMDDGRVSGHAVGEAGAGEGMEWGGGKGGLGQLQLVGGQNV